MEHVGPGPDRSDDTGDRDGCEDGHRIQQNQKPQRPETPETRETTTTTETRTRNHHRDQRIQTQLMFNNKAEFRIIKTNSLGF